MIKGRLVRELECSRDEINCKASFYEALLNSSAEALIATDAYLAVIFWNSFAEKLCGWKADEATGQKITDLLIPRLDHREIQAIIDTVRQRRSWTGEIPICRKDGTEFLALVTAAPFKGDISPPGGFIRMCLDVSRLRQVDRKLRESRELMQLAEEIADLGHWTWNVSSDTVYWSGNLVVVRVMKGIRFYLAKEKGKIVPDPIL